MQDNTVFENRMVEINEDDDENNELTFQVQRI